MTFDERLDCYRTTITLQDSGFIRDFRMLPFRSIVILMVLAAPAAAQDMATGAAIQTAISGNTVEGSMSASGAYTEFYAADGTIKGKDYAGNWSIDGDKMCFAYGTDPTTCWAVQISGDQVTWVGDGGPEGTGTIRAGNPNSF
jgi:hypothetical protein